MSLSKRILGLDLGVTSVGWALMSVGCDAGKAVARDDGGQIVDGQIVGSGVRIFSATTAGAKNEPKNRERRRTRGQRRLIRRKQQRRNNLRRFLSSHGLLPEIDATTSSEIFDGLGEPYDLRAKGIEEKLTPFEFGRAVYHLSKRRGYRSNRTSGKDKDHGVVSDGIAKVKAGIESKGFKTVGSYLQSQEEKKGEKKRKNYTHRLMTIDEFEQLWESQRRFHPQLLTDTLKSEIQNIIFYQRPQRSQRGLIGKCSFEKDKKRCDRARQEAQRFRYWQDLNNLEFQEPRTFKKWPLNAKDKANLASVLETTEELKYGRLRKILKLGNDIRINLERNEKKLKGNSTAVAMRRALKKAWDELDEVRKNRLVEELIRIDNEIALKKRLSGHWQFSGEQVEKLVVAWHQLEDGHMRLSLKAIKNVLPLIMDGSKYHVAMKSVYGDHRRKSGSDTILMLEPPPQDLRNPIVFKALCETRKVVNYIIREYGLPDEIRIEMARDLKMNVLQKENLQKQQNLNKQANQEAADYYRVKCGLEKPSANDKLKFRLWKEADGCCPYCGDYFPPELLLQDGVLEIEHIIPYSRCFDDSYMNKTICCAKCNKYKNNRAPGEIYDRESDEFFALLERVKKFPEAKRIKFELSKDELAETDWAGRQLSDTRYICREARDYMRQLYPAHDDENKYVQVVKGGSTAKLRYQWHINAILSDGDIDVKNRRDHRHHVIDAIVIALTDRSLFNLISRISARNEERLRKILKGLPLPWEGFLTDVEAAMNSLVVSHAPTRRIRGQLLEETAYGATNIPGVYVVKKPVESLTASGVKNIVDPAIKELVELRLSQFNGDVKKAFAETIYHKDGKTPIRNIRLSVTMSPETLVGIKDESGKEYKFYSIASNHHVDIYENSDTGERRAEIVPRFYAIQRNWKPADLGPEWQKLFSLCANDYIEFRGDDAELRIYRVQKMSGGKGFEITLRQLHDCKTDVKDGNPVRLRSKPALHGVVSKLQVDPLGRLTQAND